MIDLVDRSRSFPCMGGRVDLRVACARHLGREAERDLRLLEGRIRTWASRLTRFHPDSELSRLNQEPAAASARIGPTLAAVLDAAAGVHALTDGIVDVRHLPARLAAEAGTDAGAPPGDWHLAGPPRERIVARSGLVCFDLDGVGKGWIADRALRSLAGYPAALVDADGDIALRVGHGVPWEVSVADPGSHGDLARLRIPLRRQAAELGVATSGTSVHRWSHADGRRHHLIDPRTRRSARTDVVQATVVARSALRAEALAKAVAIVGSDDGLDLVARTQAEAAILLLESGDAIASLGSEEWLA
jgi:thiamine biosynthesis lipoprotein